MPLGIVKIQDLQDQFSKNVETEQGEIKILLVVEDAHAHQQAVVDLLIQRMVVLYHQKADLRGAAKTKLQHLSMDMKVRFKHALSLLDQVRHMWEQEI